MLFVGDDAHIVPIKCEKELIKGVWFKMTTFINTILLIVNIISFAATVLFAIFGVYEQIMGPADAEKLLKNLHIPLSYNQALIIGFVCLALMIVSYILRAKLSGRL